MVKNLDVLILTACNFRTHYGIKSCNTSFESPDWWMFGSLWEISPQFFPNLYYTGLEKSRLFMKRLSIFQSFWHNFDPCTFIKNPRVKEILLTRLKYSKLCPNGWKIDHQIFAELVCMYVTEVSARLSLASSTAPDGLFHLDKEAWSIPYATGS